jgi:omega-6 fatty acid desaturase (delta-12 desaturase)
MSVTTDQFKEDFKNWNAKMKQYQVPNTKKAITQIANSFALFLGLMALQLYLFDKSNGLLFAIGIAVLNGFMLGRIFIIQHDCGHRSFTKSQTANNIIGTICSICTIIPYKYWAQSHSFHHAHNGQLEFSDIGDIKCLTVEDYAKLSLKSKIFYRIYRSPFYLFTIGGFIYVVLYNRFAVLKQDYFQAVRKSVTWSTLGFLLVYLSLALIIGPKKFLIVQGINLLLFGTYALWFFYIQHQYENIYKSGKDNWDYVVSAVKGSTYYKLPWIGRFLSGNIGFHPIHHLCPTIPNYNLVQCNRENPIFEKHAPTINFWQSLKTVNANLWDDKNSKMISFGEYNRRIKNSQIS